MRCELCSDLEAPAAAAHYEGAEIVLCKKCADEIEAVFPLRSRKLLGVGKLETAIEYVEDMRREVVRVICFNCREWVEMSPQEMYAMTSYPLCKKCKVPDPSPKVVKK